MTDLLLMPLERELNRRIASSETASQALGDLEGRVLEIRIIGAPFGLYLTAMEGRLAIDRHFEGTADASVVGSVVAMGRLAGGEGTAAVREGQVRFLGDGEVAEQFQVLLDAARPDWEEELSRLTGDVVAHQVGDAVRALREFGRRSLERAGRDLGGALQGDSGGLAQHHAVAAFADEVDRLRDDVARLEARIQRLERLRGDPGQST